MIKIVASKRKNKFGIDIVDVIIECDVCGSNTVFTRYCPKYCAACNVELPNVAAMIGHGVERAHNRELYFLKGMTESRCKRALSDYIQFDEFYPIENR